MDMKKLLVIISLILFVFATRMPVLGQSIPLPFRNDFNFIMISDFGRNGYYNQKDVANMMSQVALDCSVKFYVTGGDNFQISGVQSTHDPLWMSSFENIYTHPSSHYE